MLAFRSLCIAAGRCFSTQAAETYDVVVVGGGMVGMSLAAALGTNSMTKHLRIAVVDRATVNEDALSEALPDVPDARVSTVTESSIKFFVSSGAWSHMLPLAREFGSMQVWDNLNRGTVRWEASDIGSERMGAVVENSVIQAACYRAAAQNPNISFLWPYQLQSLSLPPNSHNPGPSLPDDPQPVPFGTLASLTLSPIATKPPTQQPPSATTTSSSSTSSSSSTGSSSSSSHQAAKPAEAKHSSNKQIQARLVVAADGPRSATRSAAGLRTVRMPYNQWGVVATVATAEPHDVAWQRFLATGPLALLPTRSGFSNVVWSTTPAHARELEAMSSKEFGEAVTQALHSPADSESRGFPQVPKPPDFLKAVAPKLDLQRLEIPEFVQAADPTKVLGSSPLFGAAAGAEISPVVTAWEGHAPQSFPLSVQHAGRYVSERMALVGDAAHVVHPLAGQGVNLGFGDAQALTSAIAHAVSYGGDVGDISVLQNSYERPRMAINTGMTAALHSIYSLFRVPQGPLAHARSASLGLINTVAPLRSQLMRVAMGDIQLPSQLPPADLLGNLTSRR